MSLEVFVTNSVKPKLAKVFDLKEEEMDGFAKKAFYRGIPHFMVVEDLNRYLTKLYFQKKRAPNAIRLYYGDVFLFGRVEDRMCLITFFPVPKKFLPIEQFISRDEFKERRRKRMQKGVEI